MADYYVDSNSGSNGDTGLTQALAWATIEYAVESGGLSAGDDIWVRRTHAEYSGAPTSNITLSTYSGSLGNPIKVIGWPRAAIPNTTITSASWTNGSTTVDLVVGVTLDREKHCGRWVTAPNGKKFLITRITDSNTLIIDREYSGATVTLTNGLFQIEADEDYADRPADVDGWDSDADDLPVIDFQSANYQIQINNYFYQLHNLEVKNSSSSAGVVNIGIRGGKIQGCLLSTTSNSLVLSIPNQPISLDRLIITGNGTGSSQIGVNASGNCELSNSAIYNMGGRGLYLRAPTFLSNVNVGIEQVNVGYDIDVSVEGILKGIDVRVGSISKISVSTGLQYVGCMIENYQKVLGDHLKKTASVVALSKDVVAGSGDPYKRSGGADKIIEAECRDTHCIQTLLFDHEFETGVSSKSYRYYVQCKDLALSAEELWLEVEYVDSYDDTSEYTITKEESDEACTIRSGVSDWDQYIEVTGIAPAVASKVRIRCFVAKYDADGYIYIDPQAVVS